MKRMQTLLIAAPAALGLLAAPAAHAEWRGHGWGHHGGGWHYHEGYRGPGPVAGLIAGALLGLGVAAVASGAVVAQPVYRAPPPVYYAPPPVYQPAPGYYYAPPTVYAPQ
jgi:hypothetical protein